MTWRIRITPDALNDGIAIQIGRRYDSGHLEQVTFTRSSEVVPPTAGAIAMPNSSLTIDDELGRALLDALAGHYGGTTGGLQQRADYEHERARVDRLIGHLTAGDRP